MKRTTQTKLELTLEVLSVCVEALRLPSLSSEVRVHIRWRLTTINGKRCLPRIKSLEHQNLIRNWTQNRTQIQHQYSSEGRAKEWKVQFINDANLPTTCWSSLHQLQFNKWCTQRPEHVINRYHQADHCILHMKWKAYITFKASTRHVRAFIWTPWSYLNLEDCTCAKVTWPTKCDQKSNRENPKNRKNRENTGKLLLYLLRPATSVIILYPGIPNT